MARRRIHISPRYTELFIPTLVALKKMGGSGTNEEIHNEVAEALHLSDDVLNEMHKDSNQTEFDYQLAWARTYLKMYGAISNSARSVWAIEPAFMSVDIAKLDPNEIDKTVKNNNRIVGQEESTSKGTHKTKTTNQAPEDPGIESEENRPWKKRLFEVLKGMNEYAFERLSQRLLRECGFSQVKVTKKSGDGGIDGTAKLKINGILSFNVAFQCKRYSGTVGAPEIRDFRGSLTTDIEKGIFITTGTFTKAAIEEASVAGKQQIDLINGEAFIMKLAECGLGLKEIKDYEIDEEFFRTI